MSLHERPPLGTQLYWETPNRQGGRHARCGVVQDYAGERMLLQEVLTDRRSYQAGARLYSRVVPHWEQYVGETEAHYVSRHGWMHGEGSLQAPLRLFEA